MEFLKSSGGAATGLMGKQSAPNDLGYDAIVVLTPDVASFATKVLGLTESEWLDKINAAVGVRYIVLPIFYELESTPEDDLDATSSLGSVAFVREGKDTVVYSVIVSPFVMSQLRTLNGVEWKAYIFTSTGVIRGTAVVDSAVFNPFTIGNFRVGKEVKATGSTPATVPIKITYKYPDEWSSNPAFLEPLIEGEGGNWNPRDLKDPKAITSLTTVPLAVGTFKIFLEGYDKVPFELAAKENIIVKIASTGVVVPVTTLTPDANIPGLYDATITWTAVLHKVGMAPVGTVGAVQGFAGLDEDLEDVTPV